MRTNKGANIRKEPNTQAIVITAVPPRSYLRVFERFAYNGEDWCYIRLKDSGKKGYILSSLLEPIPTPTPTPVPTNTPAPTPYVSPTPEPVEEVFSEHKLVRTIIRCNLRKTPNGDRLGALEEGLRIYASGRIVVDDKPWLHIEATMNMPGGYLLEEMVEQLRPVHLNSVSVEELKARFPVISTDPLSVGMWALSPLASRIP